MSLFSICLLGFTIWCIFSVKKEDDQRIKISDPIPVQSVRYPTSISQFNKNPRENSISMGNENVEISHRPACSQHYKSIESIQSSVKSGYDVYRERKEFEKRLLIEPRYIQDQTGIFYDQGTLYSITYTV